MRKNAKWCKTKRWKTVLIIRNLYFRQIRSSVGCMWSSIKNTAFEMQLSFISCAQCKVNRPTRNIRDSSSLRAEGGEKEPARRLRFEQKCKCLAIGPLNVWLFWNNLARSLGDWGRKLNLGNFADRELTEGSRRAGAEGWNVRGEGSVGERLREGGLCEYISAWHDLTQVKKGLLRA